MKIDVGGHHEESANIGTSMGKNNNSRLVCNDFHRKDSIIDKENGDVRSIKSNISEDTGRISVSDTLRDNVMKCLFDDSSPANEHENLCYNYLS